jgi:hypothetical protein
MTTKYAVNAGGNWSADATWSTVSAKDASRTADTTKPTNADDVVLDDYSGNVTIDATSNCRSLDMVVGGNYANTLTHTNGCQWYIGGTGAGTGNVAIRLISGKYSIVSGTTSSIFFSSTYSAVAQTIDFGGNNTANVTFTDTGSWQLTGTWGTSSVNAAMAVTLTKGTLDTNGQTCYWGKFLSTNSNTRTLDLGASTVNLYGNESWAATTGTGFTLNAASSTIVFAIATYLTSSYQFSVRPPASGTGYGTLQADGVGMFTMSMSDAVSVVNLYRTGTAIKTDSIMIRTSNLTVTGELKLIGNSATNRLLVYTDTLGTPRTITITGATCANCTNVDFRDITFSGTASFAFGNWIGDCGGNTFVSPLAATTADEWYFYQTTNSGTHNFSDYTQWYDASGGPGVGVNQMASTRCPLPQDNCYFDGSSINGTGTVTVDQDMPRMCKTLDFTGVDAMAFNIGVLTTGQTLYGSLLLSSSVSTATRYAIIFEGRGSFNIRSAGVALGDITVQMIGGTLTQLDATYLPSAKLSLSNGTFDAGAYGLTVLWFWSYLANTRTLLMGSGTWTIGATANNAMWCFATPGLTNPTTFAETSTIAFGPTLQYLPEFWGGSAVYNNVTFLAETTGRVSVTGSNSFNNLTINGPKTVKFTKGTTQTIRGKFTVTAPSEGKRVKLDTVDGQGQFTLKSTSGRQQVDGVTLSRCRVTGGPWYAGPRCFLKNNNYGWKRRAFQAWIAEVAGHLPLTAVTGVYDLTGQAATLKAHRYLSLAKEDYATTGQAVGLSLGRYLSAAQGSYLLTGQSAGTIGHRLLVGVQGEYTLSGQAASMYAGRMLLPEQGSYALSGQSVGILGHRLLSGAQGQYSLTGQDGLLIVHRYMPMSKGDYTLTGQDVILLYNPISGATYTLICSKGTYTLTGQSANPYAHRLLQQSYGQHLLTGQQLGIIGHRYMGATPGSYVLSGQSVGLYHKFRLPTVPGAYVLTGQEVQLLLGTIDSGFGELVQQSLIMG